MKAALREGIIQSYIQLIHIDNYLLVFVLQETILTILTSNTINTCNTINAILTINAVLTIMAQNFENQPDFIAAAHALRAVGNELEKCPNLPAIQGGDAILTAIQDMSQQMTAQIQNLTARLDTIAAHQQAS